MSSLKCAVCCSVEAYSTTFLVKIPHISSHLTGQIWGNLISSQIFGVKENKTITEEELKTCGANFCPSNAANNTNLEKPAMEKVGALYTVILYLIIVPF